MNKLYVLWHWFAQTALTNTPEWSLNNRNVFSHNSGGYKSEIKVSPGGPSLWLLGGCPLPVSSSGLSSCVCVLISSYQS